MKGGSSFDSALRSSTQLLFFFEAGPLNPVNKHKEYQQGAWPWHNTNFDNVEVCIFQILRSTLV